MAGRARRRVGRRPIDDGPRPCRPLQVLLIAFTNQWCTRCLLLRPEFENAAELLHNADPPVALATVNIDDPKNLPLVERFGRARGSADRLRLAGLSEDAAPLATPGGSQGSRPLRRSLERRLGSLPARHSPRRRAPDTRTPHVSASTQASSPSPSARSSCTAAQRGRTRIRPV